MCLPVTAFFHLACLQGSPVLWHGPAFCSFLWLNDTGLHEHATSRSPRHHPGTPGCFHFRPL